jgi:TonB-linked SusC/RagA family outer membrane protein
MKSIILLCTVGTLLLAAKTHAQKTITRIFTNEPFEYVIRELCLAAGLDYSANADRFRNCSSVTERFKNTPIDKAFERICRRQPVDCRVQGDTVLVIETRDLEGQVTSETGEFLPGITITTDGNRYVMTDAEGRFKINQGAQNISLDISSVSYHPKHINIDGRFWIDIRLQPKIPTYGNPDGVYVYDGYNGRPKERSTGSFSSITQQQLTGRSSGTIASLIDNRVAGMNVNTTAISLTSPFPDVDIRGTATLLADPKPLIIVNNFPYEGNLNQLNPNDIENITVLKDAAASSIWGVRAGNGVIVITLKQGKHKQRPLLTASTQFTIWDEYDSHYFPTLSSASTLDLQDSLYNRGYYDLALGSGLGFVPPGVEIRYGQQQGKLIKEQAAVARAALAAQDVRNDIASYFYRRSIARQYHLGLQGGDVKTKYFLSAGFDKLDHGLTQGTQYRYTITSSYTYKPVDALEVTLGAAVNGTGSRNDSRPPGVGYGYAALANADGSPAIVNRDRPQFTKDSLVRTGLRDWSYRPLEESQLRDDSLHRLQTRLSLNLCYTIAKGLRILLASQYIDEQTDQVIRYPVAAYAYRNLFNNYPGHIPEGPMADAQQTRYRAINLRLQGSYRLIWNEEKWELTALAGIERAVALSDTSGGRRYSKDVDFNTKYPLFDAFLPQALLPGKPYATATDDRYWSTIANTGLTWLDRYFLSLSARMDQSNLLGARTNQLTQPLWSAGFKWRFTQEDFIHLPWLNEASLRASYGRSGNIDKTMSALLTMNPAARNQYGADARTILNAANTNLTWETSYLFNLGLDFQLWKSQLTGTVEYYHRNSDDLLSNTITRTTAGATIYRNNSAALKGHGFEGQLSLRLPLGKDWQWTSGLLFAYTTNKVTRFDTSKQKAADFLGPVNGNLLVGHSSDALFTLRGAPLDPNTGDPRALLDGKPCTNYKAILDMPADSLRNSGHRTPPWSLAFSQGISWKGISLAVTISGRFGHKYQRTSMNYSGFLLGTDAPHPDYDLRFQKPGDEANTSVPSFPQVIDADRDKVYAYSDGLVEKADNIRLRDLKLSYKLGEKARAKLRLSGATFFLYAANLCILWKASPYDLDPDSPTLMPLPKSFSAGLRLDL